MKTTLVLAVFAITGVRAFCESAIPEKWKQDRYEETTAASPFVLETPKVAEAPPPAKDEPMFLNAISNVDGRVFVVIQRVGETNPIRLMQGEKSEDGITITNIKMGDKFATTEVEIEENGKKRWIKFNESSAAPAPRPAAVPQGGGSGRPRGIPPMPAPVAPTINTGGAVPKQPQPGATGSQIPRPTNSPAVNIPRPGGVGTPPSFRGGTPGSNPAPATNPVTGPQRERIRKIGN